MKYLLKTVDQEIILDSNTFEECVKKAFALMADMKRGTPYLCPLESKTESYFVGVPQGGLYKTHYIVRLPDPTPEELEQKFERERDYL